PPALRDKYKDPVVQQFLDEHPDYLSSSPIAGDMDGVIRRFLDRYAIFFEISALDTMNQQGLLFVIADGLDEMLTKPDPRGFVQSARSLFSSFLKYKNANAKLMITARTEYLD